MILDTTFLIDLLRGRDEKTKQKAEELDKKLIEKGVASVSIMELWRGAVRSIKNEQERRQINTLLDSLIIFSFTEKEAKKGGEVEAELINKGVVIDLEDIMIASTALVKKKKLLTRNIKHFSQVDSLAIETY